MTYNKISISINMSVETAARFNAITDAMRLTNEQALTYLLDLHDKVGPKLDSFPERRPLESHLHTCVRPEVKAKLRQLAQEYGLTVDQTISILIDIHDQRPERAASQAARGSGMDAAEAGDTGRDPMAQMDAALDAIRRALQGMTSNDAEIASLREQLARSRAETQAAKEAYRRKLQAVTEQLRDLA